MFCLCYNRSYTATINSVKREELLLPLPVILNEGQMLKTMTERSRLWPRLRQNFWPWGWGQKFEADANVTRPSLRPKCRPRGQSDLQALTSVTTVTSIVVQWWLPHASKVPFFCTVCDCICWPDCKTWRALIFSRVCLSACLCVRVSDQHFYPSALTDFDETWSQGPYSDLVWPRP